MRNKQESIKLNSFLGDILSEEIVETDSWEEKSSLMDSKIVKKVNEDIRWQKLLEEIGESMARRNFKKFFGSDDDIEE